jgi:AAA family ATP:ADP antiporter
VLAACFRPFSKVEPQEVLGVSMLTLVAFLLLIMAAFVHFYGELARHVGRLKLLGSVFAFFILNLAAFAALDGSPARIALPFFLWVGVFSYTIVAQFWGLAADLCSEEQGKRLFPIIGGGSSLGAVAGDTVAVRIGAIMSALEPGRLTGIL